MTVRIPPENILDKLLRLLGKERKIVVPVDSEKADKGIHVQIKAKREGFFKTLLRK